MANFSLGIKASFIIMLAFHLSSGAISTQKAIGLLMADCNKYPTFGCHRNYLPVCASNGMTYGNFCTFCKDNRESKGIITYSHDGPC